MNKAEVDIFIDKMEEIGDIWEKSDVERVYGDVSLEDALQDRMNDIHWFADIVSKVINR